MPVIRPVVILMLAAVLLLLHVPPVTVLLSVATVPAQMPDGPVIVPALGDVFTVTICVAAISPATAGIAVRYNGCAIADPVGKPGGRYCGCSGIAAAPYTTGGSVS